MWLLCSQATWREIRLRMSSFPPQIPFCCSVALADTNKAIVSCVFEFMYNATCHLCSVNSKEWILTRRQEKKHEIPFLSVLVCSLCRNRLDSSRLSQDHRLRSAPHSNGQHIPACKCLSFLVYLVPWTQQHEAHISVLLVVKLRYRKFHSWRLSSLGRIRFRLLNPQLLLFFLNQTESDSVLHTYKNIIALGLLKVFSKCSQESWKAENMERLQLKVLQPWREVAFRRRKYV